MSAPGDIEGALEGLQIARAHLMRASEGLAGYEWSSRELRSRKLSSAGETIRQIALQLSLLEDLLEFDIR